jgi:FAD/FMN-containing dehydrogenase
MLVSLDCLQGVISVEHDKQEASAHAGTRISELGRQLNEAGVALMNQGDVDVQSIAGAVSTGTHGTGIGYGSLSTQVKALRLITASGEIVTCSESHSVNLLKAAQLSLGMLGLITQVTLRVVPAYRLVERSSIVEVEDCLSRIDMLDQCNDHAEFFWVPGRDLCALKTLNVTEEAVRGCAPKDLSPPGTLERCVLPERVDWSHRIYPSQRTVPFNEMEFAVPYAAGPDCFMEIRALMQGRHRNIRWAVEYRTQRADEIFLSPAYGRHVVAISVHQGAALPFEAFFRDVEAIFRNHDGRPHWGKLHWYSSQDLHDHYPMWEEFAAIREAMDPQGLFLNEYLRRLFV